LEENSDDSLKENPDVILEENSDDSLEENPDVILEENSDDSLEENPDEILKGIPEKSSEESSEENLDEILPNPQDSVNAENAVAQKKSEVKDFPKVETEELNSTQTVQEVNQNSVSESEMQELREKIYKILKVYQSISLCTSENSPNDIIFYVMPFGCDAEVFLGSREANTHINAIGALCWNVPMKNSVAFTESTQKLMPRLGYGIQQYSGQLLAALAIARVPINYRFPAGWTKLEEDEKKPDDEQTVKNIESNVPKLPKGKKNFAIRNLVEFEQKNCRWGNDLSLTLIGLSYYLEPDVEWVAGDDEKWTIERIVKNELDREMKLSESSATNQLLGLLCAIRCRKMALGEDSLTGEYKRAEIFMERYKNFILDLQNEIGVWHPKFFELKGVTPNQPTEMLEASGHILRWLVAYMPKSELKDERVFKAAKIVTELLEYQLTYWDPGNASGKEVEGIMAALHALTIYEKRAW